MVTTEELSSAARLFARHVHGHDAARVTGQALEQLNLTSKRQPSTQHAVAITYQLRRDAFELTRRRRSNYACWSMQSCSETCRANEHRTRHDVEAGINASARAYCLAAMGPFQQRAQRWMFASVLVTLAVGGFGSFSCRHALL